MPRTIRFHLDGELSACVGRRSSEGRGIDVTSTPEAGLLEATDDVQTAHALSEDRFNPGGMPCRLWTVAPIEPRVLAVQDGSDPAAVTAQIEHG